MISQKCINTIKTLYNPTIKQKMLYILYNIFPLQNLHLIQKTDLNLFLINPPQAK